MLRYEHFFNIACAHTALNIAEHLRRILQLLISPVIFEPMVETYLMSNIDMRTHRRATDPHAILITRIVWFMAHDVVEDDDLLSSKPANLISTTNLTANSNFNTL